MCSYPLLPLLLCCEWLVKLSPAKLVGCSSMQCYAEALEQRRNKVLAILGWNDGRRPLADVHAAIIHGMGGIGKSLLAFLVYNTVTDTQNSAQSYTRCSVQVGQHPDIDAIQNSILKQLPHPQSKVPSLRYPEALRAALKDVKNPVLLLIDDIWYSGQLSRLLPTETYLPPGSGIIITTRRLNQAQGVSSLAPRCQPYQPSLLNQEEAKQLFHRLLYQQPLPDPKCITSAQADQIATQCEGLPLLVTIMAKGLRYAPHKLKLVEGDLRGQTAFAGSREDDDDWLSLLKLSYKIMDRELCKAFLDVARLWCGLYWSEASCRFGDYLQMLVEHSLVAPVAGKHHATSISMRC